MLYHNNWKLFNTNHIYLLAKVSPWPVNIVSFYWGEFKQELRWFQTESEQCLLYLYGEAKLFRNFSSAGLFEYELTIYRSK